MGRGLSPIASAKEQMLGPVGYLQSALAVCAYMKGSYREAADWLSKMQFSANPGPHTIAAYVYPEAGMMDEARREADWLRTHAPQFVADINAEIRLRFRRPEDQERVLDSLAKAGLR